jgi:hypothetical protein
MNTFKETIIKQLEEDINDLFIQMQVKRLLQDEYITGKLSHIEGKNLIVIQPNYREYFDLADLLFNSFRTYEKQLMVSKLKSAYYTTFTLKIYDEISEIHKLMDEIKKHDFIKPYKTLSKIYNLFVGLANNLPEIEFPEGVSIEATDFPYIQEIDYSRTADKIKDAHEIAKPMHKVIYNNTSYIVTYCYDMRNNNWRTNHFSDKDKALDYYNRLIKIHTLVYLK